MTEQILRECETCHGAVGELGVFQHMARHAEEDRNAAAAEERMTALVERAEAAVRQLQHAGVVPAEVDITLVTREEAEAMGDADAAFSQHPAFEDPQPEAPEERPLSRY